MDGKTYRSRCFLRMKECTENKRIKVKHDGPCFQVTVWITRNPFNSASYKLYMLIVIPKNIVSDFQINKFPKLKPMILFSLLI